MKFLKNLTIIEIASPCSAVVSEDPRYRAAFAAKNRTHVIVKARNHVKLSLIELQ